MRGGNRFGNFDIAKGLGRTGWSIEGEYSNAHERCVFVCPRGHRSLVSWMALRMSFFCKECAKLERDGRVEKMLVGTGWTVAELKGNKYVVGCSEGHLREPSLASDIAKKLRRSPECSECEREKASSGMVSLFEEQGWTMLEAYKGCHIPVLCSCPAGHRQKKRPSGLVAGKGCQKCKGLTRKSDEEVGRIFADLGWRMMGRYVNTSVPVDCMCPKGHVVRKSLDCLRISPQGCVVCSGQTPVLPLEKRRRRNERVRNWREWSPLILAGDGYRCVICGSGDGVQAHHLNSYHKNVEERYDLDNGVSLCVRHHGGPFNRVRGSFHMVYGCMNNTKEQFEEYRRRCEAGEFGGMVRV